MQSSATEVRIHGNTFTGKRAAKVYIELKTIQEMKRTYGVGKILQEAYTFVHIPTDNVASTFYHEHR
jgi:hypothetical protein